MTDYAPNNTGRYRIRYTAAGSTHNITFRYEGDTGVSAGFVSGVESFLGVLSGYMPADLGVIGAFQAVRGSDIFLPLVNAPVWNPLAGGVFADVSDSAAFATFSGLSVLGTKARLQVMGMKYSADDSALFGDYRIQLTDSGGLDALLPALRAIPGLVAIDGEPILWYSYLNLGYHAHFQRKARR